MSKWLAVVMALVLGSACGGGDGGSEGSGPADGVRIASFDFAESELLAELYAQTLEATGIPVVRLGAVGPREVVAPALESDVIDLVPEYLGTASGYFGAASADQAGLAEAVEPRGLVVLEPAPAQDVNVFVVTVDTAEANGFVRVSDLSGFASGATFGGTVECPERPLCLPGLADTYGITFAEFVPQASLVVTAEALRQGEIDVGLMFSTSAELDPRDFVALEDDKKLQPDENLVPLARRSALERWGPDGAAALNELSAGLNTRLVRSMNERIADGEPVEAVAESWLATAGIGGS